MAGVTGLMRAATLSSILVWATAFSSEDLADLIDLPAWHRLVSMVIDGCAGAHGNFPDKNAKPLRVNNFQLKSHGSSSPKQMWENPVN